MTIAMPVPSTGIPMYRLGPVGMEIMRMNPSARVNIPVSDLGKSPLSAGCFNLYLRRVRAACMSIAPMAKLKPR